MIERAKACLTSGARESVRCAQTAPRSKRLLHSTFWNHGAGDLDLPPWAVTMYPAPSDLPLRHGDTRHNHIGSRCKEVEAKTSAAAQSEGVFLDFLYPPQALAWMHRATGQGLERWERRNAMRLPEGFVQTSRGYTSHARPARRSNSTYASQAAASNARRPYPPPRSAAPSSAESRGRAGEKDVVREKKLATGVERVDAATKEKERASISTLRWVGSGDKSESRSTRQSTMPFRRPLLAAETPAYVRIPHSARPPSRNVDAEARSNTRGAREEAEREERTQVITTAVERTQTDTEGIEQTKASASPPTGDEAQSSRALQSKAQTMAFDQNDAGISPGNSRAEVNAGQLKSPVLVRPETEIEVDRHRGTQNDVLSEVEHGALSADGGVAVEANEPKTASIPPTPVRRIRSTTSLERMRIKKKLIKRSQPNVDNPQGSKVEYAIVAKQLILHAKNGQLDLYGEWNAHLKKHYPDYKDRWGLIWTSIYIHARRADLVKAKKAFDVAAGFTEEHNEGLPIPCWNALLYAHSRGDDLEGGLATLQAAIDKGLQADQYTFHPVMEMLAKRGDVQGVKDLLSQYESRNGKKHEIVFFGSLLTAHVNRGEMVEAEATLKTAIREVKTHELPGSLTKCFNILLTGHALRRDVDETMRIFRWMKAEEVPLDADTFGALIQALTNYRQTAAAWKILRVVMAEQNIRPTAFHFALVMTGYTNQGLYEEALEAHAYMLRQKIVTSPSVNVAYFKAKALRDHKLSQKAEPRTPEALPLQDTLNELQRFLRNDQGLNKPGAKQPRHGLGEQDNATGVKASYFTFLIYIHGKRRCFEAVQKLYEQFKGTNKSVDGPIKLLGALMAAHVRAGDYEEAERCWLLVKEQADDLAPTVRVPVFESGEASVKTSNTDIMELTPAPSDDAHNATTDTGVRKSGAVANPVRESEQVKQALVTDTSPVLKPAKPSIGLNHVLTRPLRFYLYALAKQERMQDMISVVSKLFEQGYTMDNRTWNAFIRLLCQSSPPLVLLAFTLTERFLIPQFPGWAPTSQRYIPNPGALQNDLQYMLARYLRPGLLVPHYRTLVMLGAAMLQMRSIEASGRRGKLGKNSLKGLERYVGSLKQVRQQAPRTVFAVQSMPRLEERFQNQYLRR